MGGAPSSWSAWKRRRWLRESLGPASHAASASASVLLQLLKAEGAVAQHARLVVQLGGRLEGLVVQGQRRG
eukprot:3630783-Prymnesium_polylepis.1